ncbi:MAG: aminoacyl-tRNA hydrolase [Actinobacteria bacterium]|nr:aminoacyl-tRNA hydrolase [Actinomycetota bacterium]
MFLIVGLGNPGKEYEHTKHNIGFAILNRFIENLDNKKEYTKFNSLVVESFYRDKKLLLLKPLTFMNNSGIAVASAYRFYGSEIKSILIVHDDLDISLGEIKFKSGGGTAGHKGLESIANSLKSLDFDRLRFGIGRPPQGIEASEYVLSGFNKDEGHEVELCIDKAVEAIKDYIDRGIDYCMNKYN